MEAKKDLFPEWSGKRRRSRLSPEAQGFSKQEVERMVSYINPFREGQPDSSRLHPVVEEAPYQDRWDVETDALTQALDDEDET